jgi:phage replication initiation protein
MKNVKTPDFKKKLVPVLSPLADRMLDNRYKRTDKKQSVIIDHLAFSFPLASLRHCHRAGFAATTSKKQTLFPLPPKVDCLEGKTLEQIERNRLAIEAQKIEFFEKTLHVFVRFVLGFELSAPRGKGFHGYTESLTMKTQNGVDVGFIGIGGQRDTVYIQISGTGCKYLFSQCTNFVLHHWLNTVLSVSHLSRIDLAKDDYDDNFDCRYAEMAYRDDFFRTGKGGKMPVIKPCDEYVYAKDGSRLFDVEMVCIGKRTSPVYWRIYNKKLEQKIDDNELSWYRSEVELKKWSVDTLLDVDAAFAGINKFAQSMMDVDGVRTKSMTKAKVACLELASRVRWYRHVAGRALGDVLKLVDGDISTAIGLLLPDNVVGERLGIPPSYKKLINHVLEC